ncbi:DNA-binding transcriptional regulator MelR [Bacteroides ovatus]|uniref:DNA-binding transcriptional regulator MelR n=2 Tax=Bacteroides ovatus TaxID=28116 RepID=A0A6N2UV87_BACOV
MKHNNIIKLCLGIFLAFTMALPAIAQKTQTFKGVVVDTTGEPIIGASVKVVGTTTGTITDLDGKFMVVVPSGKQVEISYIGYITQVLSDFKQTKIELKEDTQQLDEVVVVGYGTQKKAHLTGAIATVPMDDIQDLASGNLASTLSGMVNGLSVSGGDARPGENARINIRQNDVLSDIGGTASEPLYVIDGYIYPVEVKIGDVTENLGATAFNNLDPSVIESISVLKDAAAAVYGARAANGVMKSTEHLLPIIMENPIIRLSPLQACSYKMFYESSILSYASPKTLANKEIVKAVLTMFLQGATEIYKMQNNLYLSSQSRKYEIYQEFLQLVMKYYTIHHGTSFYAEHLGLSLPHFCSTIKKVAGNTPLEVIASIILMDAKSRLKSTNEPVKNIALSLGFNNISFFNKFFKQHTGVTPQEYRGH